MKALVRLASLPSRPTAVMCSNDLTAIGVMREAYDYGISIPNELSVIGFDDIQGAAFHNPSLTTIRQPLHEMGIVAARILLQRIRGQATFPDLVPIYETFAPRVFSLTSALRMIASEISFIDLRFWRLCLCKAR